MFLEGVEFESIWNLAHKWANQDPAKTDLNHLSADVKEKIQRIARAAILKKISLRQELNIVFDSYIILNMLIDWRIFWPLRACYYHDRFNQSLLDSLYVTRAEILKWCELEYLTPPAHWMPNLLTPSEPDTNKKPSLTRSDKAEIAWRSFAQSMWMIDPRIHPKHMAESEYFRSLDKDHIYGIDTVKGWIADLDPQSGQRNGRPQSIEYIVDLKSGGLNKKATLTFNEK